MIISLLASVFFFWILPAPKFSTSPLLPTTYLPPPTYRLPTPPPLTPSPELELWSGSSSCGAVELCLSYGAVAVERELEWLESEQELECPRDPRAHDQVRCLPFFFLGVFVLFEEASLRYVAALQQRSTELLLLLLPLLPQRRRQQQHCVAFFFSQRKEKKKKGDGNAVTFYFLC